ncbi:hypothetical protein SAMN05660657_03573 [Geodermatophilus amargosae]|uniref:Uncharacterized protein n=1 Tax=Geodermatophilus amargosae TaxID=1296565 RepID=A0A1I7BHD4_9ACTN|nr:hypothetical protein [Geodermatophilus amargosae]SFT86590.1 hypothetical protein SAMN05660657_03573 [Geodermatophilus amargosae]
MTVHQQESPSSYRRALETAHALGRADGCQAADLEADLEADLAVDLGPASVGPWCRGLDPERFAALVWGTAGGAAPAGVVLNAPLWYAQGFGEALARTPSRQGRHPAASTHPSGSCTPPARGRTPGPSARNAVPRPRSEPT